MHGKTQRNCDPPRINKCELIRRGAMFVGAVCSHVSENFHLPEGQVVLPPPCGCEREGGSLHRACVKKQKSGDAANIPCGFLNLIFDPRAGLQTTESSVLHPSSKPDGEVSQRRR